MVVREIFIDALKNSRLYRSDEERWMRAKEIWIKLWTDYYGDSSEVWIEVPHHKVIEHHNPTGHAVLCWSVFYRDNNGVFCFVPYHAT
jgi:hypothetical protein